MLKSGIAGLGLMGQMHVAHFLAHPRMEVAALADADKDRREGRLPELSSNLDAFQGEKPELGEVRSYADVLEMCKDPDLDVIVICLPSDLHAAPAIAALESGKHVLCEKPLALHPDEGRRMVDAARRNGRTLMVGHCLRFWPEYVQTDAIMRSKKYGEVIAASFARCSPRPGWSAGGNDWFGDPKRSGGIALDLHVHDADLAVWWWGKPNGLHATGAFSGKMPSILHSTWHYAQGPAVQFEASWEVTTQSPFYFDFKITMEKGTILFDSRSGDGLQLATMEGIETIEVEQKTGYEIQDKYFIDCLVEGRSTDRCPAEESLISLECATESARQLMKKA